VRAKGAEGFSLIELMISLAIIGILATIAIPQFLSYRMRAQQAEVKTNLAALRNAEIAYFGEKQGYTDDLSQLAWAPEGAPRYLYGFSSDSFPGPSGKNDTAELAASTTVGYATFNMLVFSGVPLTAANFPAGMAVTAQGFKAAAVANLDADATIDQWSIDDQAIITLITDDVSQ